jgi:hypothetical protein
VASAPKRSRQPVHAAPLAVPVGDADGDERIRGGFTFSYPGYTSASTDRSAAENFLRTRASGAKQPVLLEINLGAGKHALPIDVAAGQCGEGELLLARNERFTVANAEMVQVDGVSVLLLRLTKEQGA